MTFFRDWVEVSRMLWNVTPKQGYDSENGVICVRIDIRAVFSIICRHFFAIWKRLYLKKRSNNPEVYNKEGENACLLLRRISGDNLRRSDLRSEFIHVKSSQGSQTLRVNSESFFSLLLERQRSAGEMDLRRFWEFDLGPSYLEAVRLSAQLIHQCSRVFRLLSNLRYTQTRRKRQFPNSI